MTSNAPSRQVIRLTAAVSFLALISCATNSSPAVSVIQGPARQAREVSKTPVESVVEPVLEPEGIPPVESESDKFSRIDREVRNLSPSDQRSIPELVSSLAAIA